MLGLDVLRHMAEVKQNSTKIATRIPKVNATIPSGTIECCNLYEYLPSLQHDPNRPEDVLKVDVDEDGSSGGDAAAALRYMAATKLRTVAQRKLRGL